MMKKITLIAGVLAILLIALTGPLYKAEILGIKQIIVVMQLAAVVGFIAIALALVQALFMRKNIQWGATGLSVLLAVLAISFPVGMAIKAGSVPPIHDITTDTMNPPKFDAILPLRAGVMNPPEYLGKDVSEQQKSAYPDIKTKSYSVSSGQVFEAAKSAVNEMGLEVVASDERSGVIEASHTSAWFGFVDDVVIRVQSKGQMAILDIRSKSRVGISDLGKNAERIQGLIEGIESQLN